MDHSFFSRLERRAKELDSLLCVGLDPHVEDLPERTAAAAKEFCLKIIAATADLAVAFKPNAGFFERFGAEGWQALVDVIAAIPDDIPVILDAKRGDIGSTSEAYACSAFESLKTDCLTVNPYLGRDGLAPFLRNPSKGIFLLCKTSNPGSTDLQGLKLGGCDHGLMVYEKVAALAGEWNEMKNIGLVVGATQPDALKRVRRLAPEMWFLAPGIGVQGGELETALKAGLRADGLGLLFPISRFISQAPDPRKAALDFTYTLREIRQQLLAIVPSTKDKEDGLSSLADGMLEAGCVQFGNFTLKSGIQSPIYIDLRRLVSFPDLLTQTAAALLNILKGLTFKRLAAIPYAALPIGTAVSVQSGWPLIFPRREAKAYGTKALIEGVYQDGETVVVLDDLATTGESKFEIIDTLKSAGLKIVDVVVLIDRQCGAKEALAKSGYQLHAVFTLTQLLDHWQKKGSISAEQLQNTKEFLNNHCD